MKSCVPLQPKRKDKNRKNNNKQTFLVFLKTLVSFFFHVALISSSVFPTHFPSPIPFSFTLSPHLLFFYFFIFLSFVFYFISPPFSSFVLICFLSRFSFPHTFSFKYFSFSVIFFFLLGFFLSFSFSLSS